MDFINQISATVTTVSKLALRDRLQRINSIVNAALEYQPDSRLYGIKDHWANFSEVTDNRAGDCEDFAILKLWLLKAAGVPLDAMYLVILRDSRRGLYHAVLAVEQGDSVFILDNAQSQIYLDGDSTAYVPVYSFGSRGAWIHGFRSKPTEVAELPLHAVHPGEPAAPPAAGGAIDQLIR